MTPRQRILRIKQAARTKAVSSRLKELREGVLLSEAELANATFNDGFEAGLNIAAQIIRADIAHSERTHATH